MYITTTKKYLIFPDKSLGINWLIFSFSMTHNIHILTWEGLRHSKKKYSWKDTDDPNNEKHGSKLAVILLKSGNLILKI